MRLGYKIGIGILSVFFVWLIYAFNVAEEMAILIPLYAGVLSIPCFAFYFFAVFLYGKYPRSRKPLKLSGILFSSLVIIYIAVIGIEKTEDFIEEYIIFNQRVEISKQEISKAVPLAIGETVNVKLEVYNESSDPKVYYRFYKNSFKINIEESGYLSISFQKKTELEDAEISLFNKRRKQIQVAGISMYRPNETISLKVKKGDVYYLTIHSGKSSKKPIKTNPIIEVSSVVK